MKNSILNTYFLTLATLAVSQITACTRDQLLAGAASLIAAQTNGCATCLTKGTAGINATYQQNNKAMSFTDSKSVLSSSLKIDYNRTAVDPVACKSYTTWISTSSTKPYVVGIQITHDNTTGNPTLYDSIVATTGDLFFNVTKTLDYIKKEDWSDYSNATQRPTRDLLKKYGDAYLDMWTDAKAADSIQWGTDCERVEGSMYTNPCGKGLPHGGSKKANGMRRYVIDEVNGSVDVLCQFDSLGTWPDSHQIRVVNGKVQYVHTITVTRGVGV